MTTYAQHVSTRVTPQTQPIMGKTMVANSAGGFVFQVDDWMRLDRFLILGSEGGSYYASERALTVDNAAAVQRCIKADGVRVVNRIVEISDEGRAPKNDPAIFALAMCAGTGDEETRRAALNAVSKVCRIGTHLFQFAESVKAFRGYGRGLRSAIARWYNEKDVESLAMQLAKYQHRNGWSHHDLMHLAHPKPASDGHAALFAWAKGGEKAKTLTGLPALVVAMDRVRQGTTDVVAAIREHGLTREMIPTEHLAKAAVWEALLEKMPMTAMVRNLGNMSKVGLLKPMSAAARTVRDRLDSIDALKKSRLHPLSILLAMKTYAQGCGMKGSGEWIVAPEIVDALDAAFYKAFDFVEPTNKRWLLGVDVSGSMASPLGGTPMSCREGAAAIAMVIAKVEKQYYCHGFSNTFVDLCITPRMRMDDVLKKTAGLPFQSTDCGLPMVHALKHKLEVDVFVVLTDSETYAGDIHPIQALQQYRQKMGIPAKLVVVGMVANEFSIADPADSGMLDCVGFDAALPQIICDFARN